MPEKTSDETTKTLTEIRGWINESAAEMAATAPQREREAAAKAEEAEREAAAKAEEAEWEAKIAEVKGNIEREERAEKQGARVELAAAAMEASEAYEKAKSNMKRVEDLVSSRSNEIDAELAAKGYAGEELLVAREQMVKRGMLNERLDEALDDLTKARSDYESAYAAWEKTVEPRQVEKIKLAMKNDGLGLDVPVSAKAPESDTEEEVTDEMIESREALPPRPPVSFSDKEKSWFKQGDAIENEAMQIAAARAEIEGDGRDEALADRPEDITGRIREAEALVSSGVFSKGDVADYTYLLNERARIDKALETAGWWKARALRKDLAKIQRGGYDSSGTQGIEDYEHKIDVAKSATAPKAAKKIEEPPRKLKLWESLKMTKGR